ncbi:MAG: hypothetical protein ACI8XM_002214 [Haloarculaceae archaeon]|jgi:hypothetical protein
MTDHIDLDDLTTEDDEEDSPNRGDWLWRDDVGTDERQPAAEAGVDSDSEPTAKETPGQPSGEDTKRDDIDGVPDGDGDGDGEDRARVPHVPRETSGKPVGIPKESGGAGSGPAGGQAADAPADDTPESGSDQEAEASGPHGGGADDMTMAVSYEAAKRLANPTAAFGDAAQWTDWIGVVGDVPAHVLNKFQRDHHVDLDFFNGSGTEPAERLAGIDRHSMFYAERMVLVGVEGQEALAERAGWEFVPLSEAAANADWELTA